MPFRRFLLRPRHPRTPRAAGRIHVLIGATIGFAALAGPAHADQGLRPIYSAVERTQEGDALVFGVYELARFDSNLFRLPDDVQPGDGSKRSSWTLTTGAGLRIDKSYGQQRLVLNATATHDHYTSHNDLDFDGRQINGTLYWHLTPSITGDIAIVNNRFANDYEYLGFRTNPDPRKVSLERIDFDWRAGAAVHPRFSFFRREDTNTSRTFQLESSKSNSAEASLFYAFRSTNTLSAFYRHGKGDGSDDIPTTTIFRDRHFSDNEYGVRGNWDTIGLISAQGELSYQRRTFETFSQRDYAGWIGNLNLVYLPTGKTQVIVGLSRNLANSQTNISSFYVNEYATAALGYLLTNKVTIKPSFSYKRQTFRGAPVSNAFALKETTRYTFLEIDWAPVRSVDVSFAVGRSTRASNIQTLQFEDHSASAFVRFKF